MAAFTRVSTAAVAAGAALVAAIGLSAATASAQVVVPGYPYPAYRYAPPDASVKFDTKPKETAVYIDGYYAGVVDDFDGAFQRLRTTPGAHEITLYLDGYRTYTEHVYLSADNTFKFKHRMEKLPSGEVAERPPAPQPPPQVQPGQGAPLPGQGAPLPRAPFGRRGPRTLPYPPNGPETAPPPPASAEANARGTLSLKLDPSDAELLVDGEPWRGTASGDHLTIDLPAGRHNLQIHKTGYIGYLTDVQIRPGETTNLDVMLKTQPQ